MTLRTDKVSSLLQKEIGKFLLDLELPAMVTVSKVETTPDLKHARIYITVLPSDPEIEKEVMAKIFEARREMQAALNKMLSMKVVPRIGFKVDYSQEYASHINKLIKEAKDDEEPV